MTLIYIEALPIARVTLYSVLRKKNLYKSPEEIDDIVHDAVAKLVMQYTRPAFEMEHVRNYIYLMVIGTLFNYGDKTFNQRHCQFPDEGEEDIAAVVVFYGDDEYENELKLQAMYEDLGEYEREFMARFGEAVVHSRARTPITRFRKGIEATKDLMPRRFFYVHVEALKLLQNEL